jgi:spoIIIJ-associated protein
MKAFLDFEDKSVEKAVQKACGKLHVTAENLKYDVISHGSSGIFGLVGAKKALIRVFLPDPVKGKRPAGREAENRGKPSGSKGDRSNREAVTALIDETFGRLESEGDPSEPEAAQPNEQAIHIVRELMDKIIAALSADVAVADPQADDPQMLSLTGPDAGMLIGKQGQTLEAIQYLADKMVAKQCSKGTRIMIDAGGYMESRKRELEALAAQLAEKTLQTGRPSTMNRMNAQDRRLVHVALKGNRAVRTQSVGSGYYRKLIIFPQKKRRQK